MIQANLKDIGVIANINIKDWSAWQADNVGLEDKPYDAVLSGGGWLGSDGSGYSWAYYAGSAANSNMSYYNQEVEDLWALASATEDTEEKGQILNEMAKILWDEMPMLPLVWQNWVFAANPDLHIEESGLNPNLFSLFVQPEKIWIEQ